MNCIFYDSLLLSIYWQIQLILNVHGILNSKNCLGKGTTPIDHRPNDGFPAKFRIDNSPKMSQVVGR